VGVAHRLAVLDRVLARKIVEVSRQVTTTAVNRAEMYRGLELEIRNKKMGRPLSPFLSSYKMHFPMATSLMHRVSGAVYSSLYYLAMIGAVAATPYYGSFPAMVDAIKALQIDPMLIMGAKFVLTWPVVYHMYNGMRHLAWDAGKGFDLPMVYKSGFTVLTIATLTTLWICSL
jgi:succinate dehydrogenase (ubiquinone) cytochrome b560 subunit